MQSFSNRQLAAVTAALGLLLVAWDFSGLDLALAHGFGGAGGFPLRDNAFLTVVLHDGAKRLAWLLALGLCVAVWWPVGWLRRLPMHRRLQLASTTLLAVLVVSALKSFSTASCPWSLADFGGVAHYTPHWQHVFAPDGGSGRCFPAGHAASGFAFVGGYFAFRETAPVIARRWLAAALLVGLALGLAQQIRGAHFTSHTLWTALICWCVAWAMDGLFARVGARATGADPGEAV
ncbi:MAG: phosphatase PAP2 family protein [Polaromonas sp.]|uniref:phosphatase PAP2 family protein n=1 Tax=Polaromonas sp. TaxID=1869339 RepID=UPI002734B18F|nr:phosphatase PAP2 family protein [Polaromonas sp.]MDP2818581.1 phosphatase PAP2 family protein [Polaromonas sp.]